MLKAVIFDFDGTLADTRQILYKVYDRLSEKHKLPPIPHDRLDHFRSMTIRERFKVFNVPLLKLPALLREGLPIYNEYIEAAEPYRGIEEMVHQLREAGLLMTIVSSNAIGNIKHFLEAHRLDIFDRVQATPGLFGKHHTIKRLLHDLKLEPAEAIYVGDEFRDIAACKKVPISIISVTWGYDHVNLLRQGEPDYLADRPEEIVSLLLDNGARYC